MGETFAAIRQLGPALASSAGHILSFPREKDFVRIYRKYVLPLLYFSEFSHRASENKVHETARSFFPLLLKMGFDKKSLQHYLWIFLPAGRRCASFESRIHICFRERKPPFHSCPWRLTSRGGGGRAATQEFFFSGGFSRIL